MAPVLAWALLLALLGAAGVNAGTTVHTVIPTECKPYMTWQALGMYYSHRRVGQPGGFTRIMCCTKEEYEKLSEAERTIVPTHWAPSYTVHPRTGDVYHAYNKPLAVYDWMSRTDVKEDYVLVIDADMIMRERFVPEELGAKPGWAVAAYFGYMKGTENELALRHVPEILPRNDTLAGRVGRRGDMAGGFTLMEREDLRRVAPLWLKYTEDVREDPAAWNLTGDAFAKKPGDKPWISEMYGYSFGCAKANVWHITHSEHMLYPGYDTVDPPKVLHYGLLWQVQGTSYEFDKHWHFDFDPLSCPPWNLSPNPRKTKKGLFAHPPAPSEFKTKEFDLLRDLLAVEPIITLNAALCERHLVACPPTDELTRECNRANALMAELDEAYKKLELPDPCTNRAKECEWWAAQGECEKTAGWMYGHCRPACKWCTPKSPKDAAKPDTPAVTAGQQAAQGGAATQGAAAQAATTDGTQQQQQQQAEGTAAQQQQAAGQTDAVAVQQQQAAAAGAGEQAAGQQAAGAADAGQQAQQQQQQQEGAQQDAAAQQAAQQQQQQEEQKRATTVDRSKMGGEGAVQRGGGDGATAAAARAKAEQEGAVDAHLAAITQTGAGAQEDAGAAAAAGGGGDALNGAAKEMPFMKSEVFGVQAMLTHHIRMLAVFWGALLVAVVYKMRQRLFGGGGGKHKHARHLPGPHVRPRLLSGNV